MISQAGKCSSPTILVLPLSILRRRVETEKIKRECGDALQKEVPFVAQYILYAAYCALQSSARSCHLKAFLEMSRCILREFGH